MFKAGNAVRRRAAFMYAGAVVAATIIIPASGGLPAGADPLPPFDSNGLDDSFEIARSRPQGPVITGPELRLEQSPAA